MSSQIEENYLKAIYKLAEKNKGLAANTAIAKALSINPATVSDMLKRLSDKKYILYQKHKGVSLTGEGKSVAVKIIRKHRLWEVFLVEKMNFSWDEVHDIAEQLEHIQSDELVNRLEKLLGNPKTCPHGDPIPDVKGTIPKIKTISLSEAIEGKSYVIKSLEDTSVEFLRYLDKINLKVGSKISIHEHVKYDGSLLLDIGKNKTIAISKKVADAVFVV